MRGLFVLLLFVTQLLSQQVIRLGDVRKIYIEKMNNSLDQYLRAAISKKFHSRLAIVLSPAEADAIMTSPNTSVQQTEKGTVDLMDPKKRVVLWSGSAGDRSVKWLNLKHGGQQQVADHLIDDLKKAMER